MLKVSGMSLEEVARATASSVGSVKLKAHRAYEKLRDVLTREHLRLSPAQFQSELLRAQNQITGRYDGRVKAAVIPGRRGQPDPSFDPLEPAFTSAFTAYAKNELNWHTSASYRALPGEIVNNWNFRRRDFNGRVLAPSTIPDLRDAMQKNANLRVFAGGGYFDLATPFYASEYELANVGLDPAVRARITQALYPSGHMLYLNDDTLAALRADLGRFYTEATAVR